MKLFVAGPGNDTERFLGGDRVRRNSEALFEKGAEGYRVLMNLASGHVKVEEAARLIRQSIAKASD